MRASKPGVGVWSLSPNDLTPPHSFLQPVQALCLGGGEPVGPATIGRSERQRQRERETEPEGEMGGQGDP